MVFYQYFEQFKAFIPGHVLRSKLLAISKQITLVKLDKNVVFAVLILSVDLLYFNKIVFFLLKLFFVFLGWIQDYKAVTVNLKWFLECLFQYKFLKITPEFQIILLKQRTVTDHTLMDESVITFIDNDG